MGVRILLGLILIFFLQFPALSQEISIPFYPVPGVPYLQSPEMTIDSAEYDTFVLGMDSKQSGAAKLFWSIHYDPQFNQQKSIWFSVKPGSHDYYFNIPSQNPNWLGWVNGFVVFPEIDQNLIKIKQAKIIKGNLLTNIRSGWQEFWGPKGRLIIGSTINTMQSSNLFGRSIFFYIYWAIGLILFGFILWEIKNILSLKRKPTLDELLLKIGKTAFLLIVAFWIMLELNTLNNDWQNLKGDFRLLGKSLDEKRTMVNTGDFYPFILFCKENLPKDAFFDFRIPPIYNDIKAKYYLYPMNHEKDAEFLIVYDMKAESELLEKYSLWKKFREGAYILKKK